MKKTHLSIKNGFIFDITYEKGFKKYFVLNTKLSSIDNSAFKTRNKSNSTRRLFFYHKMAKSAAHLPRFLLRSVLQGKQTSASSQFSRALHRDASVVSQQAQVKQEK